MRYDTWYEIKLKAFQKMFAINNGSTQIPTDMMGKDYENAMPGAANEALQMLATTGKFIIKSIDIAHIPVKSLIQNSERIRSVERGTITYEAEGTRSMYYECKGKGTMTVTIGDEEPVETVFDDTASKGYVPHKMLFDNTDDVTVRVSFTSDYPLSLKNVALYSANYESVDDIPPYSEYVRYDLRELADDYYMVDPSGIIYEGNREVSRYMATSDWFEEGYNILLLRRDKPGNYKIYYKAYPQPITLGTPDDTELVLDPEVSALLPLYIASQVYKDDDPSTATIYRNEFEVAYERLVKNVEAPSQEHFVSVSGWI